jgi:hypothetical protein
MNPNIEKWITYFAHHSDDTTFLIDLFNKKSQTELDSDYTLNLEREKVVKHKTIIERIKNSNCKQQVELCLTQIIKYPKDPQSKDIFHAFVKETLYKDWNEKQKQYYDETVIQLLNWKDFFFSYSRKTNYGLAKFNEEHRTLITKINKEYIIGVDKEDWGKKNMLAWAIFDRIHELDGTLEGFYDSRDIGIGDDPSLKVHDACFSSFCLIQLIQEGVFGIIPEKNWPFKEYNLFSENHCDFSKGKDAEFLKKINCRFHYIVTGEKVESIKPAVLHTDFEQWYENLSIKRIHITIHNRLTPISIRQAIKDIGLKISEIKLAWVTNVPD